MSHFFKNTRKFSIIFASLLLAITLTAGTFAAVTNGVPAMELEETQGVLVDYLDVGGEPEPDAEAESQMPLIKNMSFNVPGEMKGVYLVPGEDFLKSKNDSGDDAKKQAEDAVLAAKTAGMNAVIIDTVYGGEVIYQTEDSSPVFEDLDLMENIAQQARNSGLYVYAIFDVAPYVEEVSGTRGMDKLSENISGLASKYKLDGILLDGYEMKSSDFDYSEYIKSGGSMGYDNFLRQTSAAIAKTASKAVRGASDSTQIGLLANAVWANSADNGAGSDTNAEYTSFGSGFSDTRSYIELGWFDFVAVKAFTLKSDKNAAFDSVVSWWSALADEKSIPMYTVLAAGKIGSDGWTSGEISAQARTAFEQKAYGGVIYNSLTKIMDKAYVTAEGIPGKKDVEAGAASDVTSGAASLIKPLSTAPSAEITPSAETASAETASAETAPVAKTSPKAEVAPSASDSYGDDGYDEEIWSDYDDSGDTSDSEITILKSITPTGVITGDAGEIVTITATALKDAAVVASVNGETVYMSLDSGRKSGSKDYAVFTGDYMIPEPDDYDSDDDGSFVGTVSVRASYQDREESVDGAYFATASSSSSEKKKYPVQVTADQAKTYPANTRSMVPSPSLYPYPKGALDYALGKVNVKDAHGRVHTHLVLESGVRVESSDVKQVKSGPGKNSIQSISSSVKDGYTYITLQTSQKITYSVNYTSKDFTITFNNTTGVPGSASLKSNPMFSGAKFSGKDRLTLNFAKSGGFMGFKGYYNGDDLVFRFKNPPSSIKSAKIFIDAGHGGTDVGASTPLKGLYEKDLNLRMAKALEEDLKARGATVRLFSVPAGKKIEGPQRAELAEQWGADILISVHSNTAPGNPSASGTEVYHFYPFSKQLASTTSLNLSRQASMPNRGVKWNFFHVTLTSQMQSVLVETGFLSNVADFKKLNNSAYQKRIAAGIGNGIEGALKSAYTGKASNGTEFKSPIKITSSASEAPNETGGGAVTEVYFDATTQKVRIGEIIALKPKYEPSEADDPGYTWRSSSPDIVTVDNNGKITGIKAGSATVYATASDGSNKRGSIRVTVTDEVYATPVNPDTSGIPLSSASNPGMSDEYVTIYPGNSQRIEIISDDGKLIRGSDFKWKSSSTSIATVDANGIVLGKKVGEAVITATGGGATYTCDVEVSRTKVDVDGLTLDKTSLTMIRGTNVRLYATVSPKDASDKTVRWTSSNERIATVDSNGIVTAKNGGDVTITARSKSGRYAAKCDIEVVSKTVVLEELYTNYPTLEMQVGEEDSMDVRFDPENAMDKGLTYTTSNADIVSVDSDGVIVAKSKGTAIITATSTANKRLSVKCVITVIN